ncbi:hypothetical protein ASPCADRAFT_11439 [Aspergillus carbonarius ITEM 5010]|uniref:Uncharacterized protein n=1 Tax=Aspergillus carbonarius (strain ITEM 5010) TaxID=602072 RepID=A0A1R3R5L4_ASPC5|nr:hypothetical protein ASPCADRAFT_11439 [Aspergillus carbonarius ITEM 5010]
METTRLQRWLKKLEVSAEPGLSNTQLMLMNHDLQPGSGARTDRDGFGFLQLNMNVGNGDGTTSSPFG